MQSLWMLFASLAFSLMGVCVKLASTAYSVSKIAMYRGIAGVTFLPLPIRTQCGITHGAAWSASSPC